MTPHIQLSSGAFFNFLNPDPQLVTVEVIAKSLSQLCRFTGHTSKFYSVAQHSVLVSRIVPPELARWGLFHDAAEAFMGDVSSPLKQLIPDYKRIEHYVERVVWEALGLYGPLPREVKQADMSALIAEKNALMPQIDGAALGWEDHLNKGVPVCPFPVVPMNPYYAESYFLARAKQLDRMSIAA